MYEKLAGMTGTADTEAAEFKEIYDLEVMVIPTNMPMVRTDHSDVIYRTEKEKYDAAIEEIKELHKQGRPVLVGTISIEHSEKLSTMLSRTGVKHHVLNAKHHEREAEIISQAGQRGGVTISTNMAGRGTDIKLGEGVAQLGGLHILGTERHESRRIDNQLRGRSGRQGDAGSSRFYLSLDDDLLRIFGGERIQSIMERIGIEEGQPIEANLLSKAIENAQRRVEAHNFDIRKHLLEYDNVMNAQRVAIYDQRKDVLKGEDPWGMLEEMLDEVVETTVGVYVDEKQHPEEWNLKGLDDILYQLFSLKLRYSEAGRERASREADGRGDPLRRPGASAPEGRKFRQAAVGLPDEGHHAPVHRYLLERPSAGDGSPPGRDRPSGLCPEGSYPGVPEGRLRDVRGHDAACEAGHPAKTLSRAGSARGGGGKLAGPDAARCGADPRDCRCTGEAGQEGGRKGRAQRSLPLREREEVQEVLREIRCIEKDLTRAEPFLDRTTSHCTANAKLALRAQTVAFAAVAFR